VAWAGGVQQQLPIRERRIDIRHRAGAGRDDKRCEVVGHAAARRSGYVPERMNAGCNPAWFTPAWFTPAWFTPPWRPPDER
jgi:hypothetical protein